MKRVLLIFGFLIGLSGCDNGGPARPLYALNGSYSFTGKFCDQVVGSLACVQAFEPIACAGKQLPAGLTIDYFGENIMIHGSNSPMTTNGSEITVTNSGQTFVVKPGVSMDKYILEFGAGCALEFDRRHL